MSALLNDDKRLLVLSEFQEGLKEIDSRAISDDVSIKYLIEDIYGVLGIDYTMYGKKLVLEENIEYLEKFKVIFEPENETKKQSYTNMFVKLVNDLFDKYIKINLVKVDENLNVMYELKNNYYVYNGIDLVNLFNISNGEQPETVFKLGFLLNKDVKTHVNKREVCPNYTPITKFNEVIINKKGKVVFRTSDIPDFDKYNTIVRSTLGRMLIVNNSHGFDYMNVESGFKRTLFEIEASTKHICKASGEEIHICKYFPIPSDVIKVDDEYYYREAYKLWALSKKYKCEVKKYKNDKHDVCFDVFNFNDKTFKNIDDTLDDNDELIDLYKKINNYSVTPRKLIYVNADGSENYNREKLYMGIELEFDSGGVNEENSHLFLAATTNYKPYMWSSRDSSVQNGFESKTVPTELEALMNKDLFNFELGFKTLKDRGYTAGTNQTCGYHIHLSKRFFTTPLDKHTLNDKDLSKLGLTVLSMLIENNWKDLVPFTRRQGDSLDRWAPNNKLFTKNSFMRIKETIDHKSIYKLIDDTYDRYRGHNNAINNNKGETYEIRIFRGSMNRTAVLAAAQLSSNLSYIARELMKNFLIGLNNRDTDLLKKVIDDISKVTFEDIVNYKQYKELNEYIVDYSKYNE